MIDVAAAKPLGHWAMGTLTLHFAEGAVVEQKMHLDEARDVEAILSSTREGDGLHWDALAWFQFESSKVVFSSFKVSEDGGWPMDPDERRAVAKVGHPHGVLRSLFDLWSDQGVPEPEYSLLALYQLHSAAADGMDRLRWDALARRTVGNEGTKALIAVMADAGAAEGDGLPATEDLDVDDRAEPEPAPDAEEVRSDVTNEDREPTIGDTSEGPAHQP
ncbi:hypothetical protein [Nocardioides sp. WS12]|uniref:hypothetical protein n=1 Tax=Nocardioides sp. WS12 TaxID=2486272 RepID=UPI0015F7C8D8|nr:hypothetical protein [Nocardioides sp. WS12]